MMAEVNDFLASNSPVRHEVETPVGVLVVYVTPMTWIQQQEAISQFVDFIIDGDDMRPSIDFGGYWKYVLSNCVSKTEPKMSKKDLLNLSPEVGQAIIQVLPNIEGLMGAMAGGEPDPLE